MTRISSRRNRRRGRDEADLDEGAVWPTSFAVAKLTTAEEKKFAALVKKAVS